MDLKNICTPAYLYFIISFVIISAIAAQNLGNTTKYNIGTFSIHVPNVLFIFIIKLIYVLVWTFILNFFCSKGYSGISWFLFLLPLILFFVLIGVMLITGWGFYYM